MVYKNNKSGSDKKKYGYKKRPARLGVKTYNQRRLSNVYSAMKEPVYHEVISSFTQVTGVGNKIQITLPIQPNLAAPTAPGTAGTTAPGYTALAARFNSYRISRMIVELIVEQSDKPMFSLCNRVGTALTETDHFMIKGHRMHVIDATDKKVTIEYKPVTADDREWRLTSPAGVATNTHTIGYMHILQAGLAAANPKAEVRIRTYLDCKGQKN